MICLIGTTQNKWDTPIDLSILWETYSRICRPTTPIVLFAQSPFDKVLGVSNLKNLRFEWIWEKTVPTGFLNAKKIPLKAHENILVFYEKLPTYNPQFTEGASPYRQKKTHIQSSNYGNSSKDIITESSGRRYPKSVLKFKRDKGLHPTQKPVALLEYLIRTYTNEGDTILDNCMGSGSTGVAAMNARRNFIGIEKEADYFKIAQERIAEAQSFQLLNS